MTLFPKIYLIRQNRIEKKSIWKNMNRKMFFISTGYRPSPFRDRAMLVDLEPFVASVVWFFQCRLFNEFFVTSISRIPPWYPLSNLHCHVCQLFLRDDLTNPVELVDCFKDVSDFYMSTNLVFWLYHIMFNMIRPWARCILRASRSAC